MDNILLLTTHENETILISFGQEILHRVQIWILFDETKNI